MSDRKKAAKVGIFTFVVGALLAVVLFIFGGVRLFKHQTRYYIELQNSVMGLSEGVGVYFNGIHVGSVQSIGLDEQDPSLVRVGIDVEQNTPVRSDTKAIISSTGLTGLKVVDLQGGSPKATALPPDSIIPAGAGGFDKIQKQAEELADQTAQMMKRASAIMDHADQIVQDLQKVTDPQALGAIVASTKNTAANLDKASAAVSMMVAENREALKASIGSVSKATDNASQVATDLRTLIRTNQGTISATLTDLRQGARMFKDLAREVREKPSRLLLSSSPDERKLP